MLERTAICVEKDAGLWFLTVRDLGRLAERATIFTAQAHLHGTTVRVRRSLRSMADLSSF